MEAMKKHNREFVEQEGFKVFTATKFPRRKTAVVTCMDTRLVGLLEAALGLGQGDVKMIKNAGGLVTDPYGDTMRSLLVAIYELGVETVMIIPHTGCGVEGMDGAHFIKDMEKRGISPVTIKEIKAQGVDLEGWLTGFCDAEEAVRASVELVANHPLLPEGITVKGFIIDTATGALREIDTTPDLEHN